MKIVFFGGGEAGRASALALNSNHRNALAAIVWDGTGVENAPQLNVPRISEQQAVGSGDLLLCSGYGKILHRDLLSSFSVGAFNAHPSLLPAYRGRHSIQWAIANGERLQGVTIHEMTHEVDEGRYFMMRCIPFNLSDRYLEISRRLSSLSAEMLVEFTTLIIHGRMPKAIPPDQRQNQYLRKRTILDGRIDWRKTSAEILNLIRASAPTYAATFEGKDGETHSVVDYIVGQVPGEVLITNQLGSLVATGDGTIWVRSETELHVGDILR